MRLHQSHELDIDCGEWEAEGEGPYHFDDGEKTRLVTGVVCVAEGWEDGSSDEVNVIRVKMISFDDDSFIQFGSQCNDQLHKYAVNWVEYNLGWLVIKMFFDRYDPYRASCDEDWNYAD